MELQGVAEAIRWATGCAWDGIGSEGRAEGGFVVNVSEKRSCNRFSETRACLERCAHRVHNVVARGPDELMRDLIKEPAHKPERQRRGAWAGREPAGTSLEA